jgi:hypothetical protein
MALENPIIAFALTRRASVLAVALIVLVSSSPVEAQQTAPAFGRDRTEHDLRVFRELLSKSRVEGADERSKELCEDLRNSVVARIGPPLNVLPVERAGPRLFGDAVARRYTNMCPWLLFDEYRWIHSNPDILRTVPREDRYIYEQFRYAESNVEFYEAPAKIEGRSVYVIIFRGTGLCARPDTRPEAPACQEDVLFTMFDRNCRVLDQDTYGWNPALGVVPFSTQIPVIHPTSGLALLWVNGPFRASWDRELSWAFGLHILPIWDSTRHGFSCRGVIQ